MPTPLSPLPLATGTSVTTAQWVTLIQTVKAYMIDHNKSVDKLVEYDFTVRTGDKPGAVTLTRRYNDLYDIVQAMANHRLDTLP